MTNSLDSGTQLGPYEIKKQLGAGGMGEVYLAADARLGREVAIKVLPSEFATDPERLARFDQEARAAAALNHPHIAVVHDIGQENGTYFMVQERLEGQTLRDLLDAGRPALGKALDLCTEIAEALTAAHAVGIVHRDLKPENVFVSKDGHAKVLDFGLAKLMELSPIASPGGASKSPTMVGTVAGQVMGTAGYMAPEQIEGGEIDQRVDLFALGVVLYEITTGRQPFAGSNVIDTLHKISNVEPDELVDVDATLPAELERILHKALAKDPAARYQTAADIVVDLRSLAADVEADRALAVGAATPAVVSGHPSWMLAAGMAVALVVGVLAARGLWPATASSSRSAEWAFAYAFPEEHWTPPCCGRQVTIAPDDSYFAYATTVDDEPQIFLRRRDQLDAVPVPGAHGVSVTRSPDGEWIAFYVNQRGTRGLHKLALAGGDPFQLLENDGWFPSWSDDGWIYYVAGSIEIGRVPDVGGEPEAITLTGLPANGEIEHIAWMPGGKLLVGTWNAGTRAGFGIVDWETGEWRELAAEGADPRWSPSGHVFFVRGGTLYAWAFDAETGTPRAPAVPVLQGLRVDRGGVGQYDVSDAGTLVWIPGEAAAGDGNRRVQLVAAAPDGSDIQSLLDRVDAFYEPRLSPDGRRLATSMMSGGSEDIWIAELAQGVLSRLTVGGNASRPVWSSDGAWVYYYVRTGPDEGAIHRIAADFSADGESLVEGPRAWPEDASPDGLSLAVSHRDVESLDIGRLDLDGASEIVTVLGRDDFREGEAKYSPDGDYLAYVSDESGTSQVYLREANGTRRWLVTPGNGFSPAWAPDGSRIYYVGSPEGLQYVDIDFGPELVIGSPVVVLPWGRHRGPYDVFPDGRLLLVDMRPGDGNEARAVTRLAVVLNWFEELNRLAPPEGMQ